MSSFQHLAIIERTSGIDGATFAQAVQTAEARLRDLCVRYNSGLMGVAAAVRWVDDLRAWRRDLVIVEGLLWCEGFLLPKVDFDADPDGHMNAWAEFLSKVRTFVDPSLCHQIETAWQQLGVPS